jgi:hypothetical protein
MRSVHRLLQSSAVLVLCLAPALTWASGCEHDIVVPIRFQSGAVCWQHVGAGTTFTGQFGAHQHVTAAAIGQFYNADSTHEWVTTGPWQLSVSGPNGFFASAGNNNTVDTVLPQAGQYSFQVGPCAVWGSQGMIEICAQ